MTNRFVDKPNEQPVDDSVFPFSKGSGGDDRHATGDQLGKQILQAFGGACSDETTPLAVANKVLSFHMPFAFEISEVRAGLTTAQATGSIFTIDIKYNGTSIFSTLLTIDNTEKTNENAATPYILNGSSIPDWAEITVDVTQIGDGTATGLKVWLIGKRA